MNEFLDRLYITKLNQDQVNHLNSPVTPKEIEVGINSLPTKKRPGPDVLVQNFIRPSKKT